MRHLNGVMGSIECIATILHIFWARHMGIISATMRECAMQEGVERILHLM